MATLRDEIAEIKASIARIEHSLNGNGRPGLLTEVALLKQWRKSVSGFAWLICTAAITSVVGALVAAAFAFRGP